MRKNYTLKKRLRSLSIMNIDFKLNNNDRHLNIFWQYNGQPHLENNITKSFINTLDALSQKDKVKVIKDIFDIKLPAGEITFSYYLQTSPAKEVIEKFSKPTRLLFAFSPTGKTWGHDGIDKHDKKAIKAAIKASIEKIFAEEKDEDYIEQLVKDELKKTEDIISNRGGSIPDAWLLIYTNKKPLYCIAMENKLYDLNPYQLNNHCQKSLFVDKNIIIKKDYNTIISSLSKTNNFVANSFVEYMFFLGYCEVSNLKYLPTSLDEQKYKLAKKRCLKVLEEISNKKTAEKHRSWLMKVDTDNKFNKMIGLEVSRENNKVKLVIFISTILTSGREFYNHIKNVDYTLPKSKNCEIFTQFDFQDTYSKNVNIPYPSNNSIRGYIEFWTHNLELLKKTTSPQERLPIFKAMLKENLINENSYKELISKTKNHKILNPIPQFYVEYSWSLNEATKLDSENKLGLAFAESIRETYKCFNIPDKHWNKI